MLREQNASKLATVGTQRSTIEKERDEAKLSAIREKERKQKMEKIKKYTGSRYFLVYSFLNITTVFPNEFN